MNILISSAGKRVSLIRIFQKEIRQYAPQGKIYTTDANPQMAPAGYESEMCFAVPRVTSDNYIPKLLRICLDNEIGLVIPTIDTELLILAQNRTLFDENGIQIISPDEPFITMCRDKRLTNSFFKNHQIDIPKELDINNLEYPCFAKPYDGSLSKDIHIIRSSEDLSPDILNNPKLMFMELIDAERYQEYTVDMYYGKDNLVKGIVPRERVEVRAGEINKGYTRKNEIVEFLKQRMNYLPGVIGCICLQLFYNRTSHQIIGIEINPRFGGGFPLTYYAGGNYPGYIIKEYFFNESVPYSDDWKDNTLLLRYDDEIIVYDQK